MPASPEPRSEGRWIGILPQPDVVLFPGVSVLLHLNEHHKLKVKEASQRNRGLIAVALMRADWEEINPRRPPVHDVVGVGQVLVKKLHPDKTFDLIVQGKYRAQVLGHGNSIGPTPYRVVRHVQLPETKPMEIDLTDSRQRLRSIFADPPMSEGKTGQKFARLLRGSMKTATIADLLAHEFLKDLTLKQSLLADGDVARRVGKVVKEMDNLCHQNPTSRKRRLGLD
jgi:ATP-dependent Lon protease